MTPEEAAQIMNPFYPHDPKLAMKAMNKELEGNTPAWILESVVMKYFTFMRITELEDEVLKLQRKNLDPFGFNSIPYTVGDREVPLN